MRCRRLRGTGRGASEVISVLLMVAVTIVLAAMVGSVLLNIVSDVDDNSIAGATVGFDGENVEIRIVYTATQESGTTIEVKVTNRSTDAEISGSPKTVSEVGESCTFTTGDGLANGHDYNVRIVAKAPDGNRAVVLDKTQSL